MKKTPDDLRVESVFRDAVTKLERALALFIAHGGKPMLTTNGGVEVKDAFGEAAKAVGLAYDAMNEIGACLADYDKYRAQMHAAGSGVLHRESDESIADNIRVQIDFIGGHLED